MMHIEPFYDSKTATFTYIVEDQSTKRCAIIDAVLDFELESGRVTTHSADRLIAYVKAQQLTVDWILETHIHADHLTAASYLKQQVGGHTAIGSKITEVLDFWVPLFNTQADTPLDGRQFDRILNEGDTLSIGNIPVKIIHTPGHTPACISYLIQDAIFVGDTLFLPNEGTARTDFPGASAATLFQSIQRILSLPDETRIFSGHNYPAEGQLAVCESTVLEQKNNNILVNQHVSQHEYVALRNKRDEGKAVPKLILPSIQVNLRAGELGNREANGVQYIKIPLNKI